MLGSSSRSAQILHTSGILKISPRSPTYPHADVHKYVNPEVFFKSRYARCDTAYLHFTFHTLLCLLVLLNLQIHPFYKMVWGSRASGARASVNQWLGLCHRASTALEPPSTIIQKAEWQSSVWGISRADVFQAKFNRRSVWGAAASPLWR